MKRKSAIIHKHRVGWVRGSRGYPAPAQQAALEAVPCDEIYTTVEDDTLEDLYRHMQRGDEIHIVGLHRLGSTRAELEGTLRLCREKGVTVHDIETGGVVDLGCYEAAVAALGVINGERRLAGPDLARKRRDYTRAGRKIKQGAMSRADAERVWRDVKGVMTDGEAATITGWGLRTLQRHFGKSGRPAGWPKKDRS